MGMADILDQIPGIGRHNAQEIIAEIGLDMSRFPTAEHLVSWAKLCPRIIQSGGRSSAGKTGKGTLPAGRAGRRGRPARRRPRPSWATATGA